jgi:hypothetical protein
LAIAVEITFKMEIHPLAVTGESLMSFPSYDLKAYRIAYRKRAAASLLEGHMDVHMHVASNVREAAGLKADRVERPTTPFGEIVCE